MTRDEFRLAYREAREWLDRDMAPEGFRCWPAMKCALEAHRPDETQVARDRIEFRCPQPDWEF